MNKDEEQEKSEGGIVVKCRLEAYLVWKIVFSLANEGIKEVSKKRIGDSE